MLICYHLWDCNHGYLHAVTEFFLPLPSINKDEFQAIYFISSQDLNKFMSGTVYLVGCQLTLADIMLFYALHPVMMELSVQEKEQLVNLSRWFNQVNNLTITSIFYLKMFTTTDSRILMFGAFKGIINWFEKFIFV